MKTNFVNVIDKKDKKKRSGKGHKELILEMRTIGNFLLFTLKKKRYIKLACHANGRPTKQLLYFPILVLTLLVFFFIINSLSGLVLLN